MPTRTFPLAGLYVRRTCLGISAREIAKALGLNVNSYGRLERGERRCYMDYGRTIGKILGCKMDDLEFDPTIEEQLELIRIREQRLALERRAAEKGVTPETLASIEMMDDKPDVVDDDGTVVSNTLSAAPTPKPKPAARPSRYATPAEQFIIPSTTAEPLATIIPPKPPIGAPMSEWVAYLDAGGDDENEDRYRKAGEQPAGEWSDEDIAAAEAERAARGVTIEPPANEDESLEDLLADWGD